jgi:hypothetical protein
MHATAPNVSLVVTPSTLCDTHAVPPSPLQGMLSQERQRFNLFLSKAFAFVHQEQSRATTAASVSHGTATAQPSIADTVDRCVCVPWCVCLAVRRELRRPR